MYRRRLGFLLSKQIALSNKVLARFCNEELSHVVRLLPVGRPRGHVLLAHRIEAFLPAADPALLARHTHFGEAVAMAEALVERDFAVDVISHRRCWGLPRRRYDVLIAPRGPFEALAALVGADCIKIVHLDTTHWAFNNSASLARSLEVQRRRGITPERHITVAPNRAIECADYATLIGNDFVHETYAFAGKPVFELPHPASAAHPWDAAKDFEASRRRFLWLGSRGLAHKGLGLVLEAFARMPELALTVCGPVAAEPRFAEAYRRELALPNVHVHGWIDVTGADFAALAGRTLAMVFPSCAEAQAGAVINCMQAGLIPVVSRETGLDVDQGFGPGFGVELADCSVDTIVETVRRLADRDPGALAAMARRTWETARATYTRAHYKQVFGGVVERIATGHPGLGAAGFVRIDGSPAPPPMAEPRLRAVGGRPAE